MGIKRGVSLYSYQQNQFFRQMTWKDMLREVATNLDGATGIEIISEATVEGYPFPKESFVYDWHNELARYGLEAVTMDVFLDVLQFRDHVMTDAEAAWHIIYDLQIAKKLGFKNMRLITGTSMEAIEMAIPAAEDLDVRMTCEIHTPGGVFANPNVRWGTICADTVELIEKTGTKHLGIQPDFGIFQNRPFKMQALYTLSSILPGCNAEEIFNEGMAVRATDGGEAAAEYFVKKYGANAKIGGMLGSVERAADHLFNPKPTAKPEDLAHITPYIFCVHGKFYQMVEMENNPGHYEEATIMYPQGIQALKDIGYDGYINSEYEGQRSQQSVGQSANEIEEVRRHHEMMKRLIGE